jgi:tetratricopeptide (TPR) repeat protein
LVDGFVDGRHHRAVALHNLGVLALERRELDHARGHLEAAAELFVDCADTRGESLVLLRLGTLCVLLGQVRAALPLLRRCLRLTRSLKDPVGEAYALLALHDAGRRQGHDREAAVALAASLELFRRTDQRLGEVRALLRSGQQAQAGGDCVTAERLLRQALACNGRTGARFWQAAIRAALAEVLSEVGRTSTARAEWARSLALYEQIDAAEAEQVRARLGATRRPETVVAE